MRVPRGGGVVLLTILAAGVALRIAQYGSGRSLWADECLLASNVVHRSYSELLGPLDQNQAAPFGFLAIEKSVVTLLGDSEAALRLFPFIAGITSLFLFWRLADRIVSRGAVPIALGLLAVSEFPVYYSAEAKQYSSDLLVSILACLLAAGACAAGRTPFKRVHVAAIGGMLLVWLSHPVVFVLPGVLLFLLLRREDRLARLSLRQTLGVGALWVCSFGATYVISLRNISGNPVLQDYWQHGFLPFPPLSVAQLRELVERLLLVFEDPGGLPLRGFATVLLLAGLASLMHRDRRKALLLAAPILVTMCAAGLSLYPFEKRLLLFLVPFLLLLVAEGAALVWSAIVPHSRAMAVAILVVIFWHPVLHAWDYAVRPRLREEMRPVLEYVSQHKRPGDRIHVYPHAWPAYSYYAPRTGLGDVVAEFGTIPKPGWKPLEEVLDLSEGTGRIWFIAAHVEASGGAPDDIWYLSYLRQRAAAADSFVAPGAAAYLFSLTHDRNAGGASPDPGLQRRSFGLRGSGRCEYRSCCSDEANSHAHPAGISPRFPWMRLPCATLLCCELDVFGCSRKASELP